MSRSYEAIKILLGDLERKELLELFSDLEKLLSENEIKIDKSDSTNLVLSHLYHDDPIEAGRHTNDSDLKNLVNAYINYNVNEFNQIVSQNEWTEEQYDILNKIRCRIDDY